MIDPVRSRSTTLRLAAAIAVLSAGLGAAVHASATDGRASCGAPALDGGWTKVPAPRFGQGPATIRTIALGSGGTLYATNGTVVLRTDDRCTWKSVYAVSPPLAGAAQITKIVTPQIGSPRTVYLGVEQTVPGQPPTPPAPVPPVPPLPSLPVTAPSATTSHVVASRNAGDSWTSGASLPGYLLDLQAGSNRPGVVYALTEQDEHTAVHAEAAGTLGRSTDGGSSWTPQQNETSGGNVDAGTANAGALIDFTRVAVDPGNADRIWLSSSSDLWESDDGGNSAAQMSTLATISGAGPVAATRTGAGRAQIAFGTLPTTRGSFLEYTQVHAPRPEALNTVPVATDKGVDSIVMSRHDAVFAAATDRAVWLHAPRPATSPGPDLLVNVSPAHVHLTGLVGGDRDGAFTACGHDAATIECAELPTAYNVPRWTYKLRLPKYHRVDQRGHFVINTSRMPRQGAPTISPDHMRIRLPVGQQRTVPYALQLPATRKVDVYFLVDVSDSMADKIKGLKSALAEIINQLHHAHIDAWFGVGIYRSYDDTPYQRVLDIAPPDKRLGDAIDGIVAAGGNNETHLAALYQAATGKGQTGSASFIPPGQQAHFRPDALHLILNATDEGFSPGPPQPSYAEVGQALRSVKAMQIGIAYESNNPVEILQYKQTAALTPNPSIGEKTVARLSGALAPPEGADCDGNGSADVAPGDPLVCVVDPANAANAGAIAPAIVHMIMAAPDFTPISVSYAARRPVIGGVTPRVAPAVNLRYPATLTFHVTYACPANLPAGVYPASLTARLRGTPIAHARALIDCRGKTLPILPAAPLVGLGVASLPAPPTEPISNSQPQSQPQNQPQSQSQSQTQAQSQAQAQAGAAYQEQEEPQFAFAYTNPGAEGERSLAFSHYRPAADSADTPVPLYAGGGLAFVAGLALLARRRRTRPVPVTVRRSPRR